MISSVEQARLDDLIARTGLGDRKLGEVIGVSQPTVWRLRHGQIAKVEKHIRALERHLGLEQEEPSEAEMIADLVGYAQRVPALKETLLSLHRFIRNSE